MRLLNALAATLVIVGALNWGLVALAEFDLVAEISASSSARRTRRPESCTASSGWPAPTASGRSSLAARAPSASLAHRHPTE